MEGEWLPVIVGSSGITAVIVAIITAFLNKKKISAEATSIISEAAGGIVTRLEAENLRQGGELSILRAQVKDLRRKEEERDRRDRRFAEQIRLHKVYDEATAMMLLQAGLEVGDPPPLDYPLP